MLGGNGGTITRITAESIGNPTRITSKRTENIRGNATPGEDDNRVRLQRWTRQTQEALWCQVLMISSRPVRT